MHEPRVFMIGWELPPQNSGGLGVACAGLTHALADHGVDIDFTLPYHFAGHADHLHIIDCAQSVPTTTTGLVWDPVNQRLSAQQSVPNRQQPPFSPYLASQPVDQTALSQKLIAFLNANQDHSIHDFSSALDPATTNTNLLSPVSEMEHQVDDYSQLVFRAARSQTDQIDIVHAHDWMSLPAAIKIKEQLHKPLIAHIHSTEFDRTLHADFNSYITRVEYEGMRAADRVIAVSYYTKRILVEKYLIDPYKIDVVHNGIVPATTSMPQPNFAAHRPVIVFMGRLTLQKGPEYFLSLAKQVTQERPDALFVMAGNGDMYQQLLFQNAAQGLSAQVLFTDFLRGQQKNALLQRADVFIMPSVSEPFGLVALEALQANTPVIISSNSGVAEVLADTPAIDFWDIDRLAQETLHLINDPLYHRQLLTAQKSHLTDVTWEKSADKITAIYQELLRSSQTKKAPSTTPRSSSSTTNFTSPS